MSLGLVGRAIALVGIVVGLLALGLAFVSSGGFSAHYADDGTVFGFLVLLLSFASYLPAEIGRDTAGAAAGAAAFGLFLFVPATLAFNHLGNVGAGGWLGLCTVLIPIGAVVVSSAEREPAGSAHGASSEAGGARSPQLLVALVGLILVVIGIWLPTVTGGASYWNLSGSGHALGLLMLLLAVLNMLALATAFRAGSSGSDLLFVAATTFGLVEAEWIGDAFEDLGSLGSGAWLEAFGGLLLLGGIVAMRMAAARRSAAPTATPAPAAAQ